MLEKLYFGKDDAETDIGRGGLLAEGFIQTAAYRFATSGEKWLFLGRKGSGKSAICLKIHKSLVKKGKSTLVTPDEISADEIKRFELGGISAYGSKELLWRYIFCVQVAKLLLRYFIDSPKDKAEESASKLRQFLVDNGEVDDITVLERFWRTVERLKASLKITAFGTVEASLSLEPSSGQRLSDQVETIEKKIQGFAQCLGLWDKENQFYLLVDQVEKIWSNDPGSDALVIGLLRAGKHAQSSFLFLNCSVFLRIDIYEKLEFVERDKLRSDEFSIRWDKDNLITLIEARAKASIGEPFDPRSLWTKLFPRRIGEVDIKRFIASRTLNRPRDIIQLCNCCRDLARSRGRSSVSERDVLAAAKQYSRWKLVDIQNEWGVNFPFLGDILLLLSNGSYLFNRDGINQRFVHVSSDLASRYPTLRSQLSLDYLLSICFLISIIGVMKGDDPVYFCNGDFEDNLSPTDHTFVVHPCFREALQCTSAIELPQFEEGNVIQLESVRTRIRRRAPNVGIEEGEGPIDYLVKELRSNLDAIRGELVVLRIQGEIIEEINMNLSGVYSEIKKILNQYDEVEQRDALERISMYFKTFLGRLVTHEFISEKSELYYNLMRLIESCHEFIYRSGRRYRHA